MWSYEILELTKSEEEVAKSLANLPRFMWLDSAANRLSTTNRFSLFVAHPYMELMVDENGVFCLKNGERQRLLGEAFCSLEQLLPAPLNVAELKLPFQGGAVGYLSYELAKTYLPVPGSLTSLNKTKLMHLAFYDFALFFDKAKNEYSLFSRNEQTCTKGRIAELKSALKRTGTLDSFDLIKPFKPEMSKQRYHQGFGRIKEALFQGEAYQVNFTQPFVGHYQGKTLQAYLKLRAQNKCPFSAYLDFGETKLLSLSPERFLSINSERQIEVRPIKGTMPRALQSHTDRAFADYLKASEKNQQENVMIVDLMRNDLSRICKPFSIKVKSLCGLLSLPAVHHLESVVQGELCERVRLTEVLTALFPCGSITGAPKVSAMNIIESVECAARDVYCGAIGYFSADGQVDLNVAIRTLTAEAGQLTAYAGGGIVIDSTLEDEYLETFHKLSKIFTALSV